MANNTSVAGSIIKNLFFLMIVIALVGGGFYYFKNKLFSSHKEMREDVMVQKNHVNGKAGIGKIFDERCNRAKRNPFYFTG